MIFVILGTRNVKDPIIQTKPPFPAGLLSAPEEALAIEPVDSLRGISVVICEDEWATANILSMVLRKAGLQVVGMAADGESCVQEVFRTKPDLVLIDINLPETMDGIEAARQVLLASQENKPRVIIITAYSDERNRQQSKNVGVHGYVVKPFQPVELLDYIRAVIESPEDPYSGGAGEDSSPTAR